MLELIGLHIIHLKNNAVLVAISIPVFSAQLDKAQMATDVANIRAYYAQVVAENLTNSTSNWPTGDISGNIANFPKYSGATATGAGSGNTWTITYSGDGTVIGSSN